MSEAPDLLSPTILGPFASFATTASIRPADTISAGSLGAAPALITSINSAAFTDLPAAMSFISLPTTTPTVTELLDASMAVITTFINPITGTLTMGDLTDFDVGGKQLIKENLHTGLLGAAFLTPEHQVVIAFEATSGFTTKGTSAAFYAAQLNADIDQIASPTTPKNDIQAAAFARQVVKAAAADGISASNVFVTGDSLGGIEAEYTAQQTGLAGIAFEPTGIAPDSSANGNGAAGSCKNFIDVVTYGDTVANLASDIDIEQPLAGPYVPGGGTDPHYGQEFFIGEPANQSYISSSLAPYDAAIAASEANGTEKAYLSGLIDTYLSIATPYHNPFTTAFDLGTTLPPLTESILGAGASSSLTVPTYLAGGDTIPQLLAHIAATNAVT